MIDTDDCGIHVVVGDDETLKGGGCGTNASQRFRDRCLSFAHGYCHSPRTADVTHHHRRKND